eukprot:g39098.t1
MDNNQKIRICGTVPLRNYTSTIPHLFLRHIDDCIGAVPCSREEFEQFMIFANTFHPALKFTWTISDTFPPSWTCPKQSFQIWQRFTCISSNLTYCIYCSQCDLLYIRQTKCRLGD